MQATMRAKPGEGVPAMLILGACNPDSPTRRWAWHPVLRRCFLQRGGLVRETGSGVEVETVDPAMLVEVTDSADLTPLAEELRAKLERVFASCQRRDPPSAPTCGAVSFESTTDHFLRRSFTEQEIRLSGGKDSRLPADGPSRSPCLALGMGHGAPLISKSARRSGAGLSGSDGRCRRARF